MSFFFRIGVACTTNTSIEVPSRSLHVCLLVALVSSVRQIQALIEVPQCCVSRYLSFCHIGVACSTIASSDLPAGFHDDFFPVNVGVCVQQIRALICVSL